MADFKNRLTTTKPPDRLALLPTTGPGQETGASPSSIPPSHFCLPCSRPRSPSATRTTPSSTNTILPTLQPSHTITSPANSFPGSFQLDCGTPAYPADPPLHHLNSTSSHDRNTILALITNSTKSDLPTLNTLDLDASAGHCLLDPSSKGENPHHALALRESVVGEIEAKDGLPSADRNNKATLLLTGPFRTAKSSAKDLTPLVLKLQYAKYHDALRAPWKNRLLRR